MNVQQFQYILAVAEAKHFEQAADKCCITQSTLSTMISRFEDEIGIKIFDRKKKPVEITNEGATLIEQLKIIVGSINHLQELVKEIKGEVKGKLSISVIPTIAPFLLPLFLQDFALKFPDLNIEVKEQTSHEIIRQIKARELDMGIVSIPLQDPDVVEWKLYDEPFVLFDAGLRNQPQVSLSNMTLDNLWLMEEGHCMRTQVLNLCEANRTRPHSGANFDFKAGSIDSLLRFVKANRATTLLPYLSVVNFAEEEKHYVRLFSSPVPLRTVGLVVHKHFVKKKILELLQTEILGKVIPLLPPKSAQTAVISPV